MFSAGQVKSLAASFMEEMTRICLSPPADKKISTNVKKPWRPGNPEINS